jgi:hypothetical protein
MTTFGNIGDDVWQAWDTFLGHSTGLSMPVFPLKIHLDDPIAVDQAATPAGPVDKSVPWRLELNQDGLPILPSSEGLQLPDIKKIIRSFITLHYRELICCQIARCAYIMIHRPCVQQQEGFRSLDTDRQ